MEFPCQHNGAVLTRAARKKAGVPPPTPFLSSRGPSTPHQNDITIISPPFPTPALTQAANENSATEEIFTNNVKKDYNKIQNQIAMELDKENTRFSPEVNKDDDRTSCKKGGDVEQCSCDSSDSSDDEERVVWVECEREECGKWRRLPPNTVIDQSKEWYCTMHPSPHMSCDLAEERWEVSHKRAFTFTRLEPGALVWAKMSSYPQWPAVVSPDPWSAMDHVMQEREGCIYHVEFLGRNRSHIWMQEEKIEPYRARSSSTHHSQRGRGRRRRRGKGKGRLSCSSMTGRPRPPSLQHAISEAESLVALCNQERLAQCVFKELTAIKTERISQQKRSNKFVKIEKKDLQNENKVVNSEKGTTNNEKSNLLTDISNQQSQGIRKKRGRPPSNAKAVSTQSLSQTQLLRCLGINSEGNVPPSLAMTSFLQSIQTQLSTLLTSTSSNPLTNTVGVSSASIQSLATPNTQGQRDKAATINRSTTLQPINAINTSSTIPATHFIPLKPIKTRKLTNKRRQTSTKQVSPTKLIQAGLGKSPDTNVVQVVPKAVPVRRVVRPVSKRGRAVRWKSVSPTIVDYFKRGAAAMVPVESPLSSLDTEMASAQRELQEMQTLLSTFGPIVEQDTTTTERTDLCTTTVEQNAPRDGDDGYLNAEFESALTELYNIEDLIQATSHQQVPSV